MSPDEMENITKKILDSYETRINFVKGLASDTADMLGKFSTEHAEMSESLRTSLQANLKHIKTDVANFISGARQERSHLHQERLQRRQETFQTLLDFHEKFTNDTRNLLNSFAEMRSEKRSEQKESLANFTNQLVQRTAAMLKNFREIHARMASDLNKMLSSATESRKTEIAAFMDNMAKYHQATKKELDTMRKELGEFLSRSKHDRQTQFDSIMKVIRDDINDMHAAWKGLGIKMQAFRSLGIAKVKELEEAERRRIEKERAEAERKRLEQEEAERRRIEKERAEAERKRLEQEEAERKQRELAETKAMILNAVKKNALKLTEIGNVVGKAWQGLIPIMTELINDGKVSKDEDGIYHIV